MALKCHTGDHAGGSDEYLHALGVIQQVLCCVHLRRRNFEAQLRLDGQLSGKDLVLKRLEQRLRLEEGFLEQPECVLQPSPLELGRIQLR